jgi:chitin disaccharide deacetylase
MAGFDFVLCADDFGMTEAVSRGLMQAACAGRISAASAMSSMPDWRRAAQDWRASRPDVDLGLHLTLTVGGPLGRMERFAGTGEFPDLGVLLRGALSGRLPLGEIEDEFVRQIDAFCDEMDAAPTHVDGHQHVHVLPGVRDAFFGALSKSGLKVVVRDSSDSPGRVAVRRAFASKATKVNVLGAGFRRAARAAGLELNDGFAGYSDFVASRYGARQFATYLAAPGPRHLVMCHPGMVDDALRRIDPVTDAREAELGFLLSPEFADLLVRREARLIRTSVWLTQS